MHVGSRLKQPQSTKLFNKGNPWKYFSQMFQHDALLEITAGITGWNAEHIDKLPLPIKAVLLNFNSGVRPPQTQASLKEYRMAAVRRDPNLLFSAHMAIIWNTRYLVQPSLVL